MVEKDINNLFAICRERLYGDDKAFSGLNGLELDIESLKDSIIENGLSSFLYKPIKAYNDATHSVSDELVADLGKYTQKVMFNELKKYQVIRNLSKEADKRGVNFTFFKGIVIANLYPQYAERVSSDSDILVSDEEKEASEQLLRDFGYIKFEKSSKQNVQVYHNKVYEHTVELHTRLWEDYEGPKIESLKKMNLSSPETNIRITACGIEVNTLGHEKHLIYQLFHIIKHFSLNGIGIRYLVDITLFVNKYFDEINWNVFWRHMDELGYTKFVESFFRICITELKMTDKVFDNHKVTFDYSVDDLKMDLLKIGDINSKEAGWQILGAMEAYFTGEADAPKSKLSRQISMMFPSAKALPKTYEYARKHPMLLPLAWVHRDIKYIMRKAEQKDDMYSVSEKIDMAERRLRLIKELGLSEG